MACAQLRALTGWRALRRGAVVRRRRPAAGRGCAGARGAAREASAGAKVRVVVLRLPAHRQFRRLDPLRRAGRRRSSSCAPGEPLPADADLVILPGSKATIADLAALRAAGWDIDLTAHVRRGGRVLGICGGYQMLGTRIADPDGIEGPPAECRAWACSTSRPSYAATSCCAKRPATASPRGAAVPRLRDARRPHDGPGLRRPLLRFGDGRDDGAISADGRIGGCYLHGLFADDAQRAAWMRRLGAGRSSLNYEALIEQTLDELAQHLERHIDCDALLAAARAPQLDLARAVASLDLQRLL